MGLVGILTELVSCRSRAQRLRINRFTRTGMDIQLKTMSQYMSVFLVKNTGQRET